MMAATKAPFTEEAIRLLLVGPLDDAGAPIDAQHIEQVEWAWGRRGQHLARTWRAHEQWLRDAAQQRRIAPRWPGQTFFAEAVALRERKGL